MSYGDGLADKSGGVGGNYSPQPGGSGGWDVLGPPCGRPTWLSPLGGRTESAAPTPTTVWGSTWTVIEQTIARML
jgi:hypothetical protein